MSSKTTSRRQFLKEKLPGVVILSVAKLIPSEFLIAGEQVLSARAAWEPTRRSLSSMHIARVTM